MLIDWIGESLNPGQERLVYHTDHAAVLRACREVAVDPEAHGFPKPKDGHTAVMGSQAGAPAPASLPAVLRDLHFEDMEIDKNSVTITFGSGFGHWGYMTVPVRGVSEIELIPGLWFWSEGRIPRDTSRSAYYRKWMTAGGALACTAAISLMIYRRRKVSLLTSQNPLP